MHESIIYQQVQTNNNAEPGYNRQRHISFRVFNFTAHETDAIPSIVSPERTNHCSYNCTENICANRCYMCNRPVCGAPVYDKPITTSVSMPIIFATVKTLFRLPPFLVPNTFIHVRMIIEKTAKIFTPELSNG